MARLLQQVVSLLNRLIHLEYDAIGAYRVAISRITEIRGPASRSGPLASSDIGDVLGDHRRHVDGLAEVVRNLGGERVGQRDVVQALARSRLSLDSLPSEREVLEVMRNSERDLAAEYERAASLPGVPVDVLAVLRRHMTEEQAHEDCLQRRLSFVGATP
jgi:hypothetical protein